MSSCSFKTRGLTLLLALAMTSCLAGCLSLQTTPTGEIEARAAAIAADKAIAAKVCAEWVAVTYSSRDTEQTRLEVRANNAARDAYCD